ncbi:MAG: FAD-dependent protein [bacterium]
MPLLLSEIRLTPDQDTLDLKQVVAGLIQILSSEIISFRIVRRSIDARQDVRILYQVEISVPDEDLLLQRLSGTQGLRAERVIPLPVFPIIKQSRFDSRPVVIGFGPAGIFASLVLARSGAKPIVLERGRRMKERIRDVEVFWSQGAFLPESNVCFGEGGAGTFSDGKLTTRKRAPEIPWILQELVDAGAPFEILYESRPHIGTDRLRRVIVALHDKIESAGGEVRFNSRMTDLVVRDGAVRGVLVNHQEEIETGTVILALGHGAGDTLEALLAAGVRMEPKPLAVGVRIEHPQDIIDRAQYGRWAGHGRLGPSDYRLTFRDSVQGRGAYSFCMCPGGKVIAANAEPESVVTNGMSAYHRNSGYANSGMVVTIHQDDFGSPQPLSGLAFLRRMEKAAFRMGGGDYSAPAQRVTDFLRDKTSAALPPVTYRPGVVSADLQGLLPDFVTLSLKRALHTWGRKIPGFLADEAVMIGIETRTSSPVRILRGEDYASISVKGLYPVGEGAGYAGGIVSSALDGVQCIQSILQSKGIKSDESETQKQGMQR